MRLLNCALLAAIALSIPAAAHAKGYGLAGCGLGSIVFGDKPGIIQVLAATTNGTFYSQTFGITTGTSNCTDDGVVQSSKEQEAFIEANYASLSKDMAAGQGEYLSALSTLMGCSETVQNEFFSTTQSHHSDVFAPNATASQVVQNVKATASANPALASNCSRL